MTDPEAKPLAFASAAATVRHGQFTIIHIMLWTALVAQGVILAKLEAYRLCFCLLSGYLIWGGGWGTSWMGCWCPV